MLFENSIENYSGAVFWLIFLGLNDFSLGVVM